MLLPAAGVLQAEDFETLPVGTKLDHLFVLFLPQTSAAADDVDEPIVLRYHQGPEAYAVADGGAGTVVLLRI